MHTTFALAKLSSLSYVWGTSLLPSIFHADQTALSGHSTVHNVSSTVFYQLESQVRQSFEWTTFIEKYAMLANSHVDNNATDTNTVNKEMAHPPSLCSSMKCHVSDLRYHLLSLF